MAPLTWRNVDAPDLGRAAEILNSSAQNWSGAMNGFSDMVGDIRERQKANRSADALPILARVASEQGVDAALAQVNGMVRPQDMTPELQQALMNLRSNAMGYDTTRLRNGIMSSSEGREATRFNREITRENQMAGLAPELLRRRESQINGTAGSRQLPAEIRNMSDRDLLALTIAGEAGGESLQGKIGVGAVIANRARAGRYGEGLRGVILKDGQFSMYNGVTGYAGGKGGLDLGGVKVSDEDYRVADMIMNNQYVDFTNGATHYYNPSVANPDWGMAAGGKWDRYGNHVFGAPEGQAPGADPNSDGFGSLADLLPEGSLIQPQTLLDMLSNEYKFGNEVEDRNDLEYTRAKGYADTARNDAAQSYVFGQVLPGITSVKEGVDQIMASDLDAKSKTEAQRILREYADGNPEYLTPSSAAPGSVIDMMIADEQAQQAQARATNPAFQTIESVTNQGEQTFGGKTVIEQYGALKKMAEDSGVELLGTDNDVMTAVGRVSRDLGLPPELVMQAAGNAFRGRFAGSGKIELKEDVLREILDPLVNTETGNAYRSQMLRDTNRLQSLQTLRSQEAELQRQRQILADRGAEANSGRISEIDGKLEQIQEAVKQFPARTPRPAPQAQTEADPAAELENRVRQSTQSGVRTTVDETTPSPNGYAVNPESSVFQQSVQRGMRRGDIDAARMNIASQLSLSGGAFGPRVIGGIADYFTQTPQQAEANNLERIQKGEAANWYRSKEAEKLFQNDPLALQEAKRDPMAFWILNAGK